LLAFVTSVSLLVHLAKQSEWSLSTTALMLVQHSQSTEKAAHGGENRVNGVEHTTKTWLTDTPYICRPDIPAFTVIEQRYLI